MATTPTQRQARRYHAAQAATAGSAATRIGRLVASGAPWSEILTAFATGQLRSARLAVATVASWAEIDQARTIPERFAGTTAAGLPLAEPLVATIDARVPAPVEAVPEPWWDDATSFLRQVEQLVAAEILDAGRAAAQVEMVAEPAWTNYVRVLVPPSCKRCVVLAGRIYRDLDGFERHPGDDCIHVPVADWEQAHDAGLVFSPTEAFEKGYIRDLTEGERKAIEDGADITAVINSSSGIHTAELFGRRVKATRTGTTKRAQWRRQNPSRLVRLRPEAIYRIVDEEYGGDRHEARRLLRAYGYLKDEPAVAAEPVISAGRSSGNGGGGGGGRGVPTPTPEPDEGDREAWKRRQDALSVDFHGELLEPREVRFVERFTARGEELRWIRNDRSTSTADFVWLGPRGGGLAYELKSPKARAETIRSRILDAASDAMRNHGVVKDRFVIDLGTQSLTADVRAALADYNFVNGSPRRKYRMASLWVLSDDGDKLEEIRLRT